MTCPEKQTIIKRKDLEARLFALFLFFMSYMKGFYMKKIFESGKFEIGCNYWASHAGIEMWHDWREDIVEADIARLEAQNVRIMRIFPLWSDFQPIKMHYAWANLEREMRIGEDLPDKSTPEGRAGIDPVMVERFETFCRIAEKHGMKLIVGLLTGWMSGRMFVPAALERLDLLNDAEAVMWEIRYVRYMVGRFKNEDCILAWDLGNECTCLGKDKDRYSFYRWVADISMAIKCEDGTRPVVSGMHGTFPNKENSRTPEVIGELTDIQTTHPYPLFTRFCNTDPITGIKSALHATAESLMYEGIGGKPCIVEEIGTLGNMLCSDENAASYARVSAFSSYAHDLRSFLWWCANEQSMLVHTPYDWNSVERELGLFYADGTPKPVCRELSALQTFADEFEKNESKLPRRITDALCILSEDQDPWAAAYGTFLLAKEAKLDVEFINGANGVIPDARVYLIPSADSDTVLNLGILKKIYKKVEDGATLYISNDIAMLSGFEALTGNRIETRVTNGASYDVEIPGTNEKIRLDAKANLTMTSVRSKVLCADENGSPALTVCNYGKGKVYFCAYPLERIAATRPDAVSGQLYRFYEALGIRNPAKCTHCENKFLGITEHEVSENKRIITLINYDKDTSVNEITLTGGWHFEKAYTNGDISLAEPTENGFRLLCEHNNGVFVVIEK